MNRTPSRANELGLLIYMYASGAGCDSLIAPIVLVSLAHDFANIAVINVAFAKYATMNCVLMI